MQRLNTILLSTACLLALASAPALAANSGVTAAVNQSARGTTPGGAVRTIVIGDNVVTNEKIDTDGAGLVQILLPDGTTFTVGPNSSLTIDKFVYDPDANTAQVTASLARGVFRFIGGRTSKTPDGVTLNTPVGTVGVRGAVVDLSFYPNGKQIQAQIDLLFGNEVTLSGQGGALQRLYQAGYSIIIGQDGNLKLVKTPPGSTSNIQQLLAGKPGQHGGASDTPTDDQVGDSGTHKTNSDVPPDQNTPADFIPPDLAAIILATLDLSDPHDQAVVLKGEPGHSPNAFSSGVITDYDDEDSPPGVFTSDTDADANYFNLETHGSGEWQHLHVANAGISMTDPVTQDGRLVLGFNPDTATLILPDGTASPSLDVNAYAKVGIHHFHPCQCDFLNWGEWKASIEVPDTSYEARLKGYWVNGDVDDELFNTVYPKLSTGQGAEAYYSGSAVGTVVTDGGTSVYKAHGTMDMSYHLGSRTGDIYINDFDGKNFHSDLAGLSGGAASFGGHGTLDGNELGVTGAFASDGFDPAAGVIGNFSATSGPGWSASGIFAGERDSGQ